MRSLPATPTMLTTQIPLPSHPTVSSNPATGIVGAHDQSSLLLPSHKICSSHRDQNRMIANGMVRNTTIFAVVNAEQSLRPGSSRSSDHQRATRRVHLHILVSQQQNLWGAIRHAASPYFEDLGSTHEAWSSPSSIR